MVDLALYGGKPEVTTQIPRFNTIGQLEVENAVHCLRLSTLSGFLAGSRDGGQAVRRLELRWTQLFKVKHAITCNSATSGLLLAAAAVGLGPGKKFLVSPLTMSATAAAPAFLGAIPVFGDIESATFCLSPANRKVDAVVITNLFGHPGKLHDWRARCDDRGIPLIEDCAQAPFAQEFGVYAGCIGHIGVFSLNVHKHLQAGEGGVVVTNDDRTADTIRDLRNHGEVNGGQFGLNLRMTEVTAEIALAQLMRADDIIAGRQELAQRLTTMVKDIDWISPPVTRSNCSHVYYLWAAKILVDRDWFVKAMNAEGAPMEAGYHHILYKLPAFAQYKAKCPVTERTQSALATFPICGYSPTQKQIYQIGTALQKVAEYARTNQPEPPADVIDTGDQQSIVDADTTASADSCSGTDQGDNASDQGKRSEDLGSV